ncbi:MAG: nucleotidyltransferase family protein [Myxococcota bacterium]
MDAVSPPPERRAARRVQAVLLAGDRGSSRAVRGASKPFVELEGRPMVIHVLETLLHTPQVREVYVVGDVVRLEKALAEHGVPLLAAARVCPVHVLPQHDTLYENVWQAFLRTLPPGPPDRDHAIVVVPADIPLMIPEELGDFLEQAMAAQADYVIGLSPESALAPFAPRTDTPGITMAFFNLAEGRFRQNNLHFVRPLRLGNRHYIQDIYETRYQKELGNMVRLGWRILVREFRHLWVLFFYLLVHLAGVLDRRGHRRRADAVRARVRLGAAERAIGVLLRTRCRLVFTELGGAALDIDNDADLLVAEKMAPVWRAAQMRRCRAWLGASDRGRE